jgi:hypothetical protein
VVSKLPIKKQGGVVSFKGLSKNGVRTYFAENLRTSLFNDDLSNEPSASTVCIFKRKSRRIKNWKNYIQKSSCLVCQGLHVSRGVASERIEDGPPSRNFVFSYFLII